LADKFETDKDKTVNRMVFIDNSLSPQGVVIQAAWLHGMDEWEGEVGATFYFLVSTPLQLRNVGPRTAGQTAPPYLIIPDHSPV
jgi:hypothetical protein